MALEQSEHNIFEREVRRVAALLWGSPAAQVSFEGQQIDGYFRTPDCVHFVEATVSKSASNTRENAHTLCNAILEARRSDPEQEYRGWIIVLHDPTPEQSEALKQVLAKKHGIRVDLIAYDRFRARLIDAAHYLELRTAAPFGSAADPLEQTTTVLIPYVRLGLTDEGSQATVHFEELLRSLRADDLFSPREPGGQADRIVLLGEYGTGKSMTVREVFLRLRSRYMERKSFRFPVLLNLREHHGQDDPVEALERHARKIGFDHPTHLTRAWRAGHVVLLLDGFDELAPAGWSRSTINLRSFRHASSTLVREFLRQSPPSCPILVSGRRSFFDGLSELRNALGLSAVTRLLNLDEFTSDQVQEFLRNVGWTKSIPSWLPKRPLLLGVLARRALLDVVVSTDPSLEEAAAWDELLDRICDREALIDPQLEGRAVRAIAERLATISRRDVRGLGPLHQRELEEAFRSCCGYDPTERGLQLLYRLFCLGPTRDTDGAREFADPTVADALRAGDVTSFVIGSTPLDSLAVEFWQRPLQSLGMAMLSRSLERGHITSKQASAACDRVATSRHGDALLAELVIGASMSGLNIGSSLTIRGCNCPDLDIDSSSGDLDTVMFDECIFDYLGIEPTVPLGKVPHFKACLIDILEGPASLADVPGRRIDSQTDVERFMDSAAANAQVRALPVSVGRRVLVTVLRKLFLQRGSGRKASALARGLSDDERLLTPSVLDMVRRHGLAEPHRHQNETVWYPDRSFGARVRECILRPSQSSDPVMREADELG